MRSLSPRLLLGIGLEASTSLPFSARLVLLLLQASLVQAALALAGPRLPDPRAARPRFEHAAERGKHPQRAKGRAQTDFPKDALHGGTCSFTAAPSACVDAVEGSQGCAGSAVATQIEGRRAAR